MVSWDPRYGGASILTFLSAFAQPKLPARFNLKMVAFYLNRHAGKLGKLGFGRCLAPAGENAGKMSGRPPFAK
jgi:hypothetical protein